MCCILTEVKVIDVPSLQGQHLKILQYINKKHKTDSECEKARTVLPRNLHEGYGHSCRVDGQVSVQVDYDADVEHIHTN